MRCAMVNEVTLIVENLIMADPEVDQIPNYLLIGLAEDSQVAMGWEYLDGTFTNPFPSDIIPSEPV